MAAPLPVLFAAIRQPVASPLVAEIAVDELSGLEQYQPFAETTPNGYRYTDGHGFAWFLGEEPGIPEPEPIPIPNPFDRIRSNISETSGDLLRGVQPVDVSASEAFLLRELPVGGAPQNAVAFAQALRPNEFTHIFYPRRKTQEESIDAYQYETKLARLSRTYPPTIQKLVANIRDDTGNVRFGATATAGELLQYVFEVWSQIYTSWFTFEPVPELYLRLADSTPLDPNSFLTIETPVLALIQNEERTVSMRQMLERILSLFSGYVLRVNENNNFEIVPPRWAPFSGTEIVTLRREDLYALENPEVDADSVVNVATVNSRWYELANAEVVAGERAYYLDYFSVTPGNWPPSFGGALPGDERTEYDYVLDDSVVIDNLVVVRGAVELWRRPVGGSGSGTAVLTDRRNFTIISERGQTKWHEVSLRYAWNPINPLAIIWVTFLIRHKLVEKGGDDVIELFHAGPEGVPNPNVQFGYVVELLDAEAEAYVPSEEQRSGQFSDVASAEQYGLSELTIDTDVFELTVEQCQSVAEAIVVANRKPKTRYRIEQSTWNAFKVQPRNINGLAIIELTDDRDDDLRGVIEAVTYTDSYEYDSAQVSSSFVLIEED